MFIKYRHSSFPNNEIVHDTDLVLSRFGPGFLEKFRTPYDYAVFELQIFARDKEGGSILEFEVIPSIYLLMHGDGTWTAEVSCLPPSRKHVCLACEGSYPVSVTYNHYDIMGSSMLEEKVCGTREELLDALNWIGSSRYPIRQMWSYSFSTCKIPTIKSFWNKLAIYRACIAQNAIKDLKE